MAPAPGGDAASLWSAAYNGNLAEVKSLVTAKGVPADVTDPLKGSNALHWASFNGRLEVARWLIKNGNAAPDCRNRDGRTPLSFACERCQTPLAQFLVEEAGADVNSKDSGGQTPLHRVCVAGMARDQDGAEELIAWLVGKGGADPDAVDANGRRPDEVDLQAEAPARANISGGRGSASVKRAMQDARQNKSSEGQVPAPVSSAAVGSSATPATLQKNNAQPIVPPATAATKVQNGVQQKIQQLRQQVDPPKSAGSPVDRGTKGRSAPAPTATPQAGPGNMGVAPSAASMKRDVSPMPNPSQSTVPPKDDADKTAAATAAAAALLGAGPAASASSAESSAGPAAVDAGGGRKKKERSGFMDRLVGMFSLSPVASRESSPVRTKQSSRTPNRSPVRPPARSAARSPAKSPPKSPTKAPKSPLRGLSMFRGASKAGTSPQRPAGVTTNLRPAGPNAKGPASPRIKPPAPDTAAPTRTPSRSGSQSWGTNMVLFREGSGMAGARAAEAAGLTTAGVVAARASALEGNE